MNACGTGLALLSKNKPQGHFSFSNTGKLVALSPLLWTLAKWHFRPDGNLLVGQLSSLV